MTSLKMSLVILELVYTKQISASDRYIAGDVALSMQQAITMTHHAFLSCIAVVISSFSKLVSRLWVSMYVSAEEFLGFLTPCFGNQCTGTLARSRSCRSCLRQTSCALWSYMRVFATPIQLAFCDVLAPVHIYHHPLTILV